VAFVQESCVKFELISSYAQRPQVNDTFQSKIYELNEALLPGELLELHSKYVPDWVAVVLVGGYIAVYTPYVLNGDISLGTFLATIKIFKEVGEEFNEGYEQFMALMSCVGPLQRLVTMFNAPTSLRQQKSVNRRKRAMTKNLRSTFINVKRGLTGQKATVSGDEGSSVEKVTQIADEVIAKVEQNGTPKEDLTEFLKSIAFATDIMPLQAIDVDIGYDKEGINTVLENVNFTIPQGALVVLTGGHRTGKATLLRALGQIIFPTRGYIFCPSHLRLLHVSQEPIIMEMNLWKNLVFGNPRPDEKRVKRILTRMKIEFMHDYLETEYEEWIRTFSSTDIAKINLARVFIANPEILIIHRPTIAFEEKTANEMLDLLHEFVQKRGLELPEDELERRRPRTCIMSTVLPKEAVKRADMVLNIDDHRVTEKTWSVEKSGLVGRKTIIAAQQKG
jgi:ABC-type uncharacterized transport system fused permease/ATPase subunit